MAKFKVYMTVVHTFRQRKEVEIEVEAENEDRAKRKALDCLDAHAEPDCCASRLIDSEQELDEIERLEGEDEDVRIPSYALTKEPICEFKCSTEKGL